MAIRLPEQRGANTGEDLPEPIQRVDIAVRDRVHVRQSVRCVVPLLTEDGQVQARQALGLVVRLIKRIPSHTWDPKRSSARGAERNAERARREGEGSAVRASPQRTTTSAEQIRVRPRGPERGGHSPLPPAPQGQSERSAAPPRAL